MSEARYSRLQVPSSASAQRSANHGPIAADELYDSATSLIQQQHTNITHTSRTASTGSNGNSSSYSTAYAASHSIPSASISNDDANEDNNNLSKLPTEISTNNGSMTEEMTNSHNNRHLDDDDQLGPYQWFVFPDLRAIDFLKSQSSHFSMKDLHLIEIKGYETYIVEQWMSSRKLGSVICTYTGHAEDKIMAYKVKIITNEALWSSCLKYYITFLYHAGYSNPTKTKDGLIYITNLSHLPNLTLLPVPKGNPQELYQKYITSFNLRKMGCGSRSAMLISDPSKAVEDKFKQMYKIPSDVPLTFAVREIICIIQIFLYYYGLINPIYCDGLICGRTEDAIAKWWKLYGTENQMFKIKPCSTEYLSPMSLASIISFTLLIKASLELVGNNIVVPKDPLDVERFRLAIGQFQKYQNIYKSVETRSVPNHQSHHQHSNSAHLSSTSASTINKSSTNISQLPYMLMASLNLDKDPGSSVTSILDPNTVHALMLTSLFNKGNNQNFKSDLNKMKKLFKNTMIDFTSGKTLQTLNISKTQGDLGSKELSNILEINSQELEQVIRFSKGRRMTYLWNGKGKPIDLDKYSLSSIIMHTINTKKEYSQFASQQNQLTKKKTPEEQFFLQQSLEPTLSSLQSYGIQLEPVSLTTSSGSDEKSVFDGNSSQFNNELQLDVDSNIGNNKGKEFMSPLYKTSSAEIVRKRSRSNRLIHRGSFEDDDGLLRRTKSGKTINTHNDYYLREESDKEASLFFNRLKRRNSIPLVNKELNTGAIGLNMTELGTDCSIETRNNVVYSQRPIAERVSDLKRSHSFSKVENLLVSDLCASSTKDITVDWLAAQYLNVLLKYENLVSQKSNNYIKEVVEMQRKVDVQNVGVFRKVNIRYERVKNETTKVFKKQLDLEERILNSERLNARLKYEMRLLATKTKDVESNLRQLFEFKIVELQKQFGLCSQELAKAEDAIKCKSMAAKTTIDGEKIKAIPVSNAPIKPQSVTDYILIIFAAALGLMKDIWFNLFPNVDNSRIRSNWKLIDRHDRLQTVYDQFFPQRCDQAIDLKNGSRILGEDCSCDVPAIVEINDNFNDVIEEETAKTK